VNYHYKTLFKCDCEYEGPSLGMYHLPKIQRRRSEKKLSLAEFPTFSYEIQSFYN